MNKVVAFKLMKEGTDFTLENQDKKIKNVSDSDILDYIDIMINDSDQFVTLTAPRAIEKIRYVQAALTDDEIELQIGVEKEKCYLYKKMCTEQECSRIFLDFFHNTFVPDMEEFEPVMFME